MEKVTEQLGLDTLDTATGTAGEIAFAQVNRIIFTFNFTSSSFMKVENIKN